LILRTAFLHQPRFKIVKKSKAPFQKDGRWFKNVILVLKIAELAPALNNFPPDASHMQCRALCLWRGQNPPVCEDLDVCV